jgi:hypothetical protein
MTYFPADRREDPPITEASGAGKLGLLAMVVLIPALTAATCSFFWVWLLWNDG